MQISKISVMICAAAICASPLSVRAADTEAQIKMREALRQKMSESDSKTSTTPNSVNVTKPVQPSVQPAPKAPTTPPVQTVRTPVQSPVVKVMPASPAVDAAKEAALRQALEQAMAAKIAAEPVAPPVIQTSVAHSEIKTSDTKSAITPLVPAPPMFDPNLPLSAEKQARLAALLIKYKADEVTPQQYHEQRAKILAE